MEQAQVAMEEDKSTTPNTHAEISVCVQIEAMPAILDDFGLVTGEILANENRPNIIWQSHNFQRTLAEG